jgi:hypothetical protein
MKDNDVHSEKQPFLIDVTEFGIVMEDNDVHFLKQ